MADDSPAKILTLLKKDTKAAHGKITKSIVTLTALARKAGNKILVEKCLSERKKIDAIFNKLQKEITSVQFKVKSATENQLVKLKVKIGKIEKLKSKLAIDNKLLETKRKSLLVKSSEIESEYDEISKQHLELLQQKEEIDGQTEMLRVANQEILEKNQELETKAESLLDQTDYLHEANETISNMHQELARQKDEILHKNEELQSLNEEKSNLIGIVAHDLKSPLNQIKGLVSIIRMTSTIEGEAADCLSMIEASAIRLNNMIGKILDTESIESKQLNLNMEEIDLSELLYSLQDRFDVDASRKKITIHVEAFSGLKLVADRNYLTQILENLLSNAIKFSPEEKNIYLRLVENEGNIITEVKDEGPGLTDDDKKKLFSKYQKLSAKPTGNESSTGLGLSIVKKFTESMGGQIWCESDDGQGASFFVKFKKS